MYSLFYIENISTEAEGLKHGQKRYIKQLSYLQEPAYYNNESHKNKLKILRV